MRKHRSNRASPGMRLLAISLASLFLMPSPANSNYLYEVLPPELHPYVLLIVDNSGSMQCQDGLFDETTGERSYDGLYQEEGQNCHPNYCRRKDGSDLWACPDITEAQADDPSFLGSCMPEDKGPWCNATREECEERCDRNCKDTCAEWAKKDCNCVQGPCLEYGVEKYDCEPGPCLEWNMKTICEPTDECLEHQQVPGDECVEWAQVDGDVCLEYHTKDGPNCVEWNQMDGPNCVEWNQMDGPNCVEWNQMDGDVCLVWNMKDGDVCQEYYKKDGDVCLQWNYTDGDVCLEYNMVDGEPCLEYNMIWIPPVYDGGECLSWSPASGPTACTSEDCRNATCTEQSPKCTDTTCKTYGPEYGCQEEFYNCRVEQVLKGKGDNQWYEDETVCDVRIVGCTQDCIEWNQSCVDTCDVFSWEQCTERAPLVLREGTGEYQQGSCKKWSKVPGSCKKWNQVQTTCKKWNKVDDLDRCKRWNQVPDTCRTWNQVDDPNSCRRYEQVDDPNSCRRYEQVPDLDRCKTWNKVNGPCTRYALVDGPCIKWKEECHEEEDDTCKVHDEDVCKERPTDECVRYDADVCEQCDYCKTAGPPECECYDYCYDVPAECDCPSRMETAQSVLETLIPGLDNLTLGLARYGKFEPGRQRELAEDGDVKNCGVRIDDPLPGERSSILERVRTMVPEGGTPIAKSLRKAREHIIEVASSDPAAACRGYYVILVTDGEESCALDEEYDPDQAELEQTVLDLRSIQVGDVNLDVRTFILGFGPELAKDNLEDHSLSKLARLGGTAEQPNGTICEPRAGEACSDGIALFALRRNELVDKMKSAFQKITEGEFSAVAPVIGSVPQVASEVGRVARNFLVYSTFRQPGYSGHLYGIRLFEEASAASHDWRFTNLDNVDLNACGQEGNPCVFDAGRRLTERTKARMIFTGAPSDRIDEDGGVTLPLADGSRIPLPNDSSGYGALGSVFETYADLLELDDLLSDEKRPPNFSAATAHRLLDLPSTPEDQERVVSWLHGEGRAWKLADIYHGGPAIVGGPPYEYRTRGYDHFKTKLRRRPEMIYVGANDGMIHAFHAGPKLFDDDEYEWKEHDWEAGDEAWAYLPVNMLARASSAILESFSEEPRFFSQDLSCRIDDVLVRDNLTEDGDLDCGGDELCGWRTVLLCGQGWGGSWLVAIDVSDPFDPKPMWESTVDDLGESSTGMGRTWSLPSVALLNLASSTTPGSHTTPTWAAVYGSGYNADMMDDEGKTYPAYRLLNLPFDGAYAYHGDGTAGEDPHVFVQNLANGRFLKIFHQHGDSTLGSVVADIPLLDVDGDGFTDVAYVGGWESQLGRISFGKVTLEDGTFEMPMRTHPSEWTNSCSIFSFGENKPITSSPTVMVDPKAQKRVYLFAGAGVDRGSFPDEQSEAMAEYGFRGFYFDDDGSASCPSAFNAEGEATSIPDEGNLCTVEDEDAVKLSEILSANTRLLGSPLLTIQPNTETWLSFTTWNPDKSTCSDGTASLYCLNVQDRNRCVRCGYLADGGEGDRTGQIVLGDMPVGQKLPSPVSADGQIYVLGPDGLLRVGNQGGDSTGISGEAPVANQNAPRRVVISWREIFEED
ncbi:MAG TPA: hypothetical protein VN033_13060 [Vulgatibacter sp.]|nr:hypothetical protein [Vulgatibacter sp.]